MQFNPEDELLGGPRCRNCHRGSSGCGGCHNTSTTGIVAADSEAAIAAENKNLTPPPGLPQTWRSDITNFFMILMDDPAMGGSGMYPTTQRNADLSAGGQIISPFGAFTMYNMTKTSNGLSNEISLANAGGDIYGKPHQTAADGATIPVKSSRMVDWTDTWRTVDGASVDCGDDGISWPHRTLGWKMLKDDLFGIDIGDPDNDGTGDSDEVAVGETRSYTNTKAHDIDSVCLDCHNPTVWNASSASDHVDDPTTAADDMDDDLLLRGLP